MKDRGSINILIAPGTFDYSNIGDTAMLLVAISRLREIFPSANITVISADPTFFSNYDFKISTVNVIGRNYWSSYRGVFRGFYKTSGELSLLENWLCMSYPYFYLSLIAFVERFFLYRSVPEEVREYIDTVLGADLIVVSGMGMIHDDSKGPFEFFRTLDLAIHHKIPVALFGQGIGPIHDPGLWSYAKKILPFLSLTAVREKNISVPLLLELGVPERKIIVTGDDAVEMAYKARQEDAGTCLGIGIRVAKASCITLEDVWRIKEIITPIAIELNAKLIPIPIMDGLEISDSEYLKVLCGEDGGSTLDTCEKVLEQVARCRVVIAGSYHSSVFSLSQGIPSVGLVKTEYYVNKLKGVAGQFGEICSVCDLRDENFETSLRSAIVQAWNNSNLLRPKLLDHAQAQMSLGKLAYQRLLKI